MAKSQAQEMQNDDDREQVNENDSPLSEEERRRIDKVRSHSKAENTRAAYTEWWNRFQRWLEGRGDDTALPIDAELVALYLEEHKGHYKVNTLEIVKKAIRHAHLSAGFDTPTEEKVVVEVMGGLKREKKGEGVVQAEPLTREGLARIIATARNRRKAGRGKENKERARIRGNRDIALAHVQFDGMLRPDELVELHWGDIEYNPDGKSGVAFIRHSKTDQEGEGAVQWLSPGAMAALEAIRPDNAAPSDEIFPFDTRMVRLHINRAGIEAGLGDGLSGHSARVGMLQELVQADISEVAIVKDGRWSGFEMISYYSRKLAPSKGAVAQWYQRVNQGSAAEEVRFERPPIAIRALIQKPQKD